ncbi:hypothetical protein [Leptospira dzoumogneensis]|uniref:Uncharacterized protein n=1 Tax=Leptospira dzoumogneensis TaxID=2484904 RepID=A0A4Z1AHW8_9LEPT|nr:hypothetical protein [Leptospira dzoumogneensis]TGM98458.1 hypothetical protein EHR06_11000 [Leptospira dzoumogneensis]
MNEIEQYDFTDCLLIDFGVDKLISSIYILTEAYYPLTQEGKREKGLLKIVFSSIGVIQILKTEEFEFDINLAYDPSGDHVKANEIYSIKVSTFRDQIFNGSVNSDMLKIELQFKSMEIKKIDW